MAKISLALVPGPKGNRRDFSRAWLEIPLVPARATLFNYSPASWSKLENTGAVAGPLAWPFRCAVWLGDEDVGLCWFCESDEAFSPADPARTIEVLPGTDATILRIRLAETAPALPSTWTFGLQATPVKPFPKRFNANHTVHAPQMGAGITIKRPEVWWTAQRAFPEGKIKETLDATPDAEKAEKFAEIAKEKSDCPSGSKGGDLGFFTHGQMVKEFDEAAFSLPIGTISDVVKTQFGFHLILVTDKKEAAAAEGDKPAEPESVKASHILVKAPAERPVPDVKDVEKSLKNRGESEEISKFMKDILSNSGIKAADEYKHMLP